MAWTTYHDSLVQEAIALMTEPEWYSQTSITDRLEVIRSELLSAGDSLEEAYNLDALISEYDTARNQAADANEARYRTAIDNAGSTVDETTVMSYPQIARHMSLAHWSPITDSFGEFLEEQRSRSQVVFDQWTTIKTTFDTDLKEVQSSYSAFADSQDNEYQGIVDNWNTVWTSLQERLAALSEQSRADIQDAHDAERSKLLQGLIDRGLYNSTLYNALVAGSTRARAAELKRLDEGLTDRELGLYTNVLNAQVDAMVRRVQAVAQARLAEIGLEGDRAKSRRDALAAQAQVLSELAKEQMQIELGKIAHRFQSAAQLQSVYEKTLDVVIARNDVAPSLADLVNLTLQAGRGAGTTLPVDALTPLTTYALLGSPRGEE